MKKVLVGLTLICLSLTAMAQTKKLDVPQLYVTASVSPLLTSGTFDNKSLASGELGIKVKKVKFGVAVGSTSLSKGNCYTTVRVTPTLWESGNFSVNGSLGGGIVWTSRNFMTEYGASVGYNIAKNLQLSAGLGGFYFTGSTTSGSVPFATSGLTFSF
jgi:hypothetical protein